MIMARVALQFSIFILLICNFFLTVVSISAVVIVFASLSLSLYALFSTRALLWCLAVSLALPSVPGPHIHTKCCCQGAGPGCHR